MKLIHWKLSGLAFSLSTMSVVHMLYVHILCTQDVYTHTYTHIFFPNLPEEKTTLQNHRRSLCNYHWLLKNGNIVRFFWLSFYPLNLLKRSGVPQNFWFQSLCHASYCLRRTLAYLWRSLLLFLLHTSEQNPKWKNTEAKSYAFITFIRNHLFLGGEDLGARNQDLTINLAGNEKSRVPVGKQNGLQSPKLHFSRKQIGSVSTASFNVNKLATCPQFWKWDLFLSLISPTEYRTKSYKSFLISKFANYCKWQSFL